MSFIAIIALVALSGCGSFTKEARQAKFERKKVAAIAKMQPSIQKRHKEVIDEYTTEFELINTSELKKKKKKKKIRNIILDKRNNSSFMQMVKQNWASGYYAPLYPYSAYHSNIKYNIKKTQKLINRLNKFNGNASNLKKDISQLKDLAKFTEKQFRKDIYQEKQKLHQRNLEALR